jgi:hypothetical protein
MCCDGEAGRCSERQQTLAPCRQGDKCGEEFVVTTFKPHSTKYIFLYPVSRPTCWRTCCQLLHSGLGASCAIFSLINAYRHREEI